MVRPTRTCTWCGLSVTGHSEIRRHARTHRGEALRCPHCPRIFTIAPAYIRHVQAQHDPAERDRRFWSKVNKDGPVPDYAPELGPCWIWTASFQKKGYGRYSYPGGKYAGAHKFAYELLVGPVPEGLELDHLCRVPTCCRPDHLEPVTHDENIRRGLDALPVEHCGDCRFWTANPAAMASHRRHRHPLTYQRFSAPHNTEDRG